MAKFLTRFDRPKLWDGYPFLLSVIVGDVYSNLNLVLKGYGVDGSLLATHESTATEYFNQIVDFNITEVYGSLTNVSYITATVHDEFDNEMVDLITIDVETACNNPIMLMGRNSLGGVLQWLFDHSQELEPDYGTGMKSDVYLMSTLNLTLNRWSAIQDFITLGEVYRNNIVEFTSSTNKTMSKVGQQVYSVSTDGSKIGVIVKESRNSTLTRFVKHTIELEVMFPEMFSI